MTGPGQSADGGGERWSFSDVHAALRSGLAGYRRWNRIHLSDIVQARGQNRVEAWITFTYKIHYIGTFMHEAGPVEATPGLGPEREY